MTEIRFYHLQRDTAEKAVPELLKKALDHGYRIFLKLPNPARCDFYDDWLWRYRNDGFIPHGGSKDPHGSKQPVWIGCEEEAPNQATMILAAEGAALPDLGKFSLACTVFSGHNQEGLEKARQSWSDLKRRMVEQPDLKLTYWTQQANGGWLEQK